MHMCICTINDPAQRVTMPTTEHCGPRAALGAIYDHLMDHGQCARASGAMLMANHVLAAARSIANAQTLLEGGDTLLSDAVTGATVQAIRLWSGEPTGLALVSDGGGPFGRRIASGLDGSAALPPAIASHDLAWELLASPAGRTFATDDIGAALLARSLAQTCWIAQGRRSRWSTSMGGAATVVRLLRSGRAFPLLDPSGPLIDAACDGLIASLGWRPALASLAAAAG